MGIMEQKMDDQIEGGLNEQRDQQMSDEKHPQEFELRQAFRKFEKETFNGRKFKTFEDMAVNFTIQQTEEKDKLIQAYKDADAISKKLIEAQEKRIKELEEALRKSNQDFNHLQTAFEVNTPDYRTCAERIETNERLINQPK